eukprot:566346-Rhodomonas_salina.3
MTTKYGTGRERTGHRHRVAEALGRKASEVGWGGGPGCGGQSVGGDDEDLEGGDSESLPALRSDDHRLDVRGAELLVNVGGLGFPAPVNCSLDLRREEAAGCRGRLADLHAHSRDALRPTLAPSALHIASAKDAECDGTREAAMVLARACCMLDETLVAAESWTTNCT